MKRTNVVIDDALLDEAVRLSGKRTYARTIERALAEMVRRLKARAAFDLAGGGIWSGDLGAMRGDLARESRGVYRKRAGRVPR